MYKCKYFKIHELVPPNVYEERGERAWYLLDNRMLMVIDRLREKFGLMTINNYEFGGVREWAGLRTSNSPYYSAYSQHSFGRAFDIIFKDTSTDRVRNHILANQEEFPEIGGIELGTSWLHIDGRNHDSKILTFKG